MEEAKVVDAGWRHQRVDVVSQTLSKHSSCPINDLAGIVLLLVQRRD